MNDDEQPPSLRDILMFCLYVNHREAIRRQMAAASRGYLRDAYCEDARVQEHLAIPGYN